MEYIKIDDKNIDTQHICCAIGNDKRNKLRADSKKDWMKERFADGLVFIRLDARGKFFIEYMPIEKAWKPVLGENFLLINCLWVSGKYKEKGIAKDLLDECIEDAKSRNKDGIAVVTGNKVMPFLTDKKFFLHHGFEVVDEAPPYFELLVLKLNSNAKEPEFTEYAKKAVCEQKDGFTFIYSNQCPFMEEYIQLLSKILEKKNIPYEAIKLESSEEAKNIGSPFGTLGIYYNGDFQTHILMSEKKFDKFVDDLVD